MRVVVQRVVDEGVTVVLMTDDHVEIKFPLALLPGTITVGDVLNIDISHTNTGLLQQVHALQASLLEDN
ncbi:hypothetical protein PTSG_11882 [Salpingoeca rosetta]|uniref:Uncharacterized protein n=1 Tax=Salpingoeca rosetta (strain ATCC 50818 / BSB-021) TaxID=946362 RepID=F2U2E0_SALR5|nr:uncharacterized protein PTSG_11882 [Salpingoeca rosetta]EGD81792.1 hypothetical protein PTSG_11882 [Salpingoeca rosetta]|eukprot:XP_004996996.1 hypothetical protein PTSG_11882 [Salpingoeca rosetta]